MSKASARTIERQSLVLFSLRIAGMGLTFLLHIIVARLLGVDQYAFYIYVFTWLGLLLLLSVAGFDTAVLKFVPLYREQGKPSLLRGILTYSQRTVIVASIVIGILGSLLLYLLPLSSTLYGVFICGFVTLPLFSLLHLRCSWLQAVEQVTSSHLIHHILRPAFFLVVFSLTFLLYPSVLNAQVSLCLWFPGLLLLIFYAGRSVRRTVPEAFQSGEIEVHTRTWYSESSHLLLISGLQFLLAKTDVVMLGMFDETRNAGIYAVASQIAGLTALGHMVSSAIISPRFSTLHAARKIEELQAVFSRAARINLVVSTPALCCIVLFGLPLLGIYGVEFTTGYLSLVILAGSQFIVSLLGAVGLVMTLTGHHKKAGRIIALSVLFNLILNALLIPLLGPPGAALATAITATGRSLFLFRFVYRELGLLACPVSIQPLARRLFRG